MMQSCIGGNSKADVYKSNLKMMWLSYYISLG